jgi:hypothetical protein
MAANTSDAQDKTIEQWFAEGDELSSHSESGELPPAFDPEYIEAYWWTPLAAVLAPLVLRALRRASH